MTHILKLTNGLTVLAEELPGLRTAAFAMSLPAGCRHEPKDRLGLASVTCEMVQRGAGPRDSREIMGELDLLGVDRNASISSPHTTFSAAMPAESFADALAIYADIVRSPHLPADQFEDAQRGSLLELQAAADDLAGRAIQTAKLMQYGDPIGRDPLGNEPGLLATTIEDVQKFFARNYQPCDAVLAVAGKFDWQSLQQTLKALFESWQPQEPPTLPTLSGAPGYRHLNHASQQTHIALSLPAIPYSDPRQMLMHAAVGILGSGVSSRLFTRVREERGLCYSISAGYYSSKQAGSVTIYAGTTTARAQETLDVTWRELEELTRGIGDDEVERLKVRLASTLVLELESSASRASSMVSDFYHWGRVISTDELLAEIDRLDGQAIAALWREQFSSAACLSTVGPEPLVPPWNSGA